MDLATFLKQVDELAAQYPSDLLKAILHNSGQTVPEEDREYFLERLRSAVEGKPTE